MVALYHPFGVMEWFWFRCIGALPRLDLCYPFGVIEMAVKQMCSLSMSTIHKNPREGTLYAGTLEAGRYWFQWDGKDDGGSIASSGVYLYRLIVARGKTMSGKMMFVR